MKNIYTFFLLIAAVLVGSLPALANTSNTALDRVVAVVNNDVITQQELDKRFQFVLRQNKYNLPQKQQRSLYRKVLGDLVNEQVQKQFATRNNIRVTDKEIELAIAELERRQNMSRGGFFNLASGLEDSAKEKVKADITWQKIIGRHIRPRVVVNTNEVDRMIDNLINQAVTIEKELIHIFIPVDSDDNSEMDQIEEIYEQLQDDASQFETVASSYDPENKGYLGWFAEGELAPTLEKAVKSLDKGAFSQPVQTSLGWHIAKIKDVRQNEKFETRPYQEYKLHALTLDMSKILDTEDTMDALQDFDTLGDMREFILNHEKWIVADKTGERAWVRAENLPNALQNTNLSQGMFTPVHTEANAITIYYVDDVREQLPEKLRKYRMRITERLTANRTNLTARRFLRDLRRAAYVEIRL